MKKALLIALLLSASMHSIYGQEKKLRIFRFNPTQLITSTLSMGLEAFNKDMSRSSVINLGVRYKSIDSFYSTGAISPGLAEIDQFDYWKGLTASYDYRFYIPSFKKRTPNFLNEEYRQSGVYLSPGIRLDYNNRDYDRSYYEVQYNENNSNTYRKVADTGKINYLGILPAINMGVQFNVFQRGYIDLYVGGGLRVNSVNEVAKERTSGGYYSNSSNAITELIIKEGVRPTGGVTFGIEF